MSWVEGIGDEVIEFFIFLLVVIISTIAWWSTRIIDRPAIRTVLVFERRAHTRSSPQHSNNMATAPVTTTNSENSSYAREIPAPSEENKPPAASTSVENSDEGTSQTQESRGPTTDEEEQNAIVENMDSNCVVRRRRLNFFNSQSVATSGTSSAEDSVNPVESADNVSTTAETSTETENNTYHIEETHSTAERNSTEENDITIKLKYINDDLKLVNGKLKEPLGDFRRRHFEPELSSNKLVKLIFNGQVLQRDDVTLQGCGLFDNCVVHCLVHQKRTSPMENGSGDASGNEGRSTPDSNRSRLNGSREQAREWDLGNLFFAIVSFVLGAAWYFRYEYAQLYTVTATIALVGLTGIFTVLLVGMYFPDPEPVQPTRS